MKRFNASEIIMLLLAVTVSIVLVIAILGIAIWGPDKASIEVRTAVIDLLKVVIGGILGAAAVKTKSE